MNMVTELQLCNICCVVVVHVYVEGGVLCVGILYYQLKRIVKSLVRKIAALATFENLPVLNTNPQLCHHNYLPLRYIQTMQSYTHGCRHFLLSQGQKLIYVERSSVTKEPTLMVIKENISESDYRLFPTQMRNRGDQKFGDDREVQMVEIRWLITKSRTYVNWKRKSSSHDIIIDIIDIFVNCNWVNTRWQWYSTHNQHIGQHK